MSLYDQVFERANGIFRFIRENLNKENMSDEEIKKHLPALIEKMNAFKDLYKEVRGVDLLGEDGLIDINELEEWKEMLEMFKKVGDIIWNLEKQFPELEKELTEYFELDAEMMMVKIFLMGTTLKKAKKRKALQPQKPPEVQKNDKKELNKTKEIFQKFEKFMMRNIPEIPEINNKTIERNEDARQFVDGFKDMVPWYLIYHTAKLELDGEKIPQKLTNKKDRKIFEEHLKFKNDMIKSLMKYYYDYEKQKEEYVR